MFRFAPLVHLPNWVTRPFSQSVWRVETSGKAVFLTFDYRPPHGFLRKRQFKFLSEQYRIILWNINAMDYQASLKSEKVIRNICQFERSGSIITFHDSVKAEKNLKYALPAIIRKLKSEGYRFLPIPYLKKVP